MTGGSTRLRQACILAAMIGTAAGLATPAAVAGKPAPPTPLRIPGAQLEPVDWSSLAGWQQDDLAAAFTAFRKSCGPLVEWKRQTRRAPARTMRRALADVCVRALRLKAPNNAQARAFFKANFRPLQIARLGEESGLLTGYYEPVLEGSRFPSDIYDVPVYAKPSNLIAPGRHAKGAFPNKGRVGRRIGRRKIVPYWDRGQIEDGILAGRGLEICWLKDPIDAFFMQIQGSARVKLDTGKTLRLNYAAHNGLPYTAVGRILIERGEVSREQMSMEQIRDWMNAHPEEAKDLRRENRAYVFMREVKIAEDEEPRGAQGVPLTPRRSIAVDQALHVYGTPFFISAELPIADETAATPFRHLMVAQDTGSAIVGPARADIYFGAGETAGEVAGRIKQYARFVMLVPREIDPVVAGARMPIPHPRPWPRPIVVSSNFSPPIPPIVVPLPKPRPRAATVGRQ